MAKTTTRAQRPTPPAAPHSPTPTEHKMEEFAEDLGRLLGHAQNKADSWLDQRKAIVEHLTELRDTANRLIAQMGGTQERQAEAPAARRGPGRPKKRTMSAEAREKIAAAQRRRWAKQKASGK